MCVALFYWYRRRRYTGYRRFYIPSASVLIRQSNTAFGVLFLHAVKPRFREPRCTLCRTTSMRTGEDNRITMMPLLRLSFTHALLSICLVLALL